MQTLENNPAFIHGGPFANIAHGCNSVLATKTALKLSDYVVTEAGFGADLGAEKFIDIKCRKSGLRPQAVVIVATIRALKYHGGVDLKELNTENLDALAKGVANLERHVNNIRNHYGLPCVVAINHFTFDTDAEIELLKKKLAHHEAPVVVCRHWAEGGKGAEELARTVVDIIDKVPSDFHFVYEDDASLWDKVTAIATKLYGASEVTADSKIREPDQEAAGWRLRPLSGLHRQDPIFVLDRCRSCAARRPHHEINIREVRLAAGAEFVVMVCGDDHDHAGPAEGALGHQDRPRRQRQGHRAFLALVPRKLSGFFDRDKFRALILSYSFSIPSNRIAFFVFVIPAVIPHDRWYKAKADAAVPARPQRGTRELFFLIRTESSVGPWEAPWRVRRSAIGHRRGPRRFPDRPRSSASRH